MILDLHTHSTASDGALSPNELIAFAVEHLVDVLAITDHDTTMAYEKINSECWDAMTIVPGIEFSTHWAGRSIHIVGLNIDLSCDALQAGIASQQQARLERAKSIAKKLRCVQIDDPFDAVQALAAGAGIGRPHFAQHLVNIGKVANKQAAFKKYLGTGKLGDIKSCWAPMQTVISWIRAAGGVAILAHPVKYKLTFSKLRLLLAEFVQSGGAAIEVVCGQQAATVTRRLAELAREYDLAVSCGSDFHDPRNAWSRPGRFPEVPASLRKVWDEW